MAYQGFDKTYTLPHNNEQKSPLMTDQQDFHQALALAAHELCTPLTLIKYYAEAIKESDPAERDRLADLIMQLSQELCDSSRMLLQAWDESQKTCEPPEPLLLQPLLQAVVEQFSPLLKAKNIKVRLESPAGLKTTACKAGGKTLLNNLLHNAIKFSPPGSTICLDVSPNPLTISVTDQAKTINQELKEEIFQPLVKQPSAEPHTGFGLGLYICQQIVAQWGTKLWLEPGEHNVGNRFKFTLPE